MKYSRAPTGFMTIEVAGSVAYIDNVVITGDDVPDNTSAVSSPGKLAATWGQMKSHDIFIGEIGERRKDEGLKTITQ